MQESLIHARCIDDVESTLLKLLAEHKQLPNSNRIGFVSGSLFSDGPKFVERNMRRLEEYTNQLRAAHQFPIFSAIEVFYSGLSNQLEEYKGSMEARRPRLITFWKNVLSFGHITDIFMTPGWERSEGAQDEHLNAQKSGVTIHYITQV
jgi:hypothetical protein